MVSWGDGEALFSWQEEDPWRQSKRLDPWRLSRPWRSQGKEGPMWRKRSLQHLPASKLLSSDILQGAWHTSTAFRRNIMSNWALPRQWHDRDSTEVSGVWFSSSVALKLWTYESGCSLDCGLCIPWEGALLPRGLVHTQSSLEQQIPAPEGGKASLVLGAERLGPLLQFGRYRGQIVCSIGHLIRCQMQL